MLYIGLERAVGESGQGSNGDERFLCEQRRVFNPSSSPR